MYFLSAAVTAMLSLRGVRGFVSVPQQLILIKPLSFHDSLIYIHAESCSSFVSYSRLFSVCGGKLSRLRLRLQRSSFFHLK